MVFVDFPSPTPSPHVEHRHLLPIPCHPHTIAPPFLNTFPLSLVPFLVSQLLLELLPSLGRCKQTPTPSLEGTTNKPKIILPKANLGSQGIYQAYPEQG